LKQFSPPLTALARKSVWMRAAPCFDRASQPIGSSSPGREDSDHRPSDQGKEAFIAHYVPGHFFGEGFRRSTPENSVRHGHGRIEPGQGGHNDAAQARA
jgi:hypothetical protein